MHDHTSSHLFECKSLPTSLSSLDLWTNPDKVEPFRATWGGETVGCHMIRVLDSAGSTLVEWGRQQQQHDVGDDDVGDDDGDVGDDDVGDDDGDDIQKESIRHISQHL